MGAQKSQDLRFYYGRALSNYAKDKEDYANCQSYFYIASQQLPLAQAAPTKGVDLEDFSSFKALDLLS